MDFGSAKPKTGRDSVRIEQLVDIMKLPDGKWVTVRLMPMTDVNHMISIKTHWINIIGGKTRKEVKIPKTCIGHDAMTDEENGNKCPYCELDSQTGVKYYANAIVRSIQEDAPSKIRVSKAEKESGYKDIDSESWTPVRVLAMPGTLVAKIQGLKPLNKVKNKAGKVGTFDVNDERFGCDISVMYNSKGKGGDMYQVQLGSRSPLNEEEKEYLVYKLDNDILTGIGVETEAQAKAEVKKMEIVDAASYDDDDDDDDDDSLGKKSKGKGKRKPADDFDDEDDDDVPPPKSKKPAAKSKSKVDDEDEDDEDDDDDVPPPKSKKQAAKSKSKVDFDDEDDDDDEDEDDVPPPKSKKPAAKSKSKVDYDDDDDEDDEDDDDEDDTPPPKSKSKSAAKSKPAAKSKSKSKVDDDDEDDDDEDDDDYDDIPF